MRKCSHSAHHTLTELNITPLLDLAFVLLVIFIITTAPPVTDTGLRLPTAAKHEKEPPRKANYITVNAAGDIFVNKIPVDVLGLQPMLASMRADDPDLSVILRGDGQTPYLRIRAVLDACQQANVTKLDLATEPVK